ncbi:MAG: hypothetical protein QCH96_07305, partial [Candidatus Thermoplasmatota archaeon]|nr:hypothetical protein [Candidatus Thermoplasmatota archaeon]
MEIEEIISFLSMRIPLIEITIGNMLAAILIFIIGYFITILATRYIRRAMKKAHMTQLLIEFVSRVSKLLLLIVVLLVA